MNKQVSENEMMSEGGGTGGRTRQIKSSEPACFPWNFTTVKKKFNKASISVELHLQD